jgi:hypothetical protein
MFLENGIMSNLTCLPDAHREVTENPTLQAPTPAPPRTLRLGHVEFRCHADLGAARNIMIRRLTKQEVEASPYKIWNEYVQIIASDYGDLAPAQRPAYLVFRYENEVQNGGHLQFFENGGTERLQETIAALGALRAHCQETVLREAGQRYLGRARSHPQSVEEFVVTALEGEFSQFDSRFHECSTPLQTILEQYLDRNQDHFIQII